MEYSKEQVEKAIAYLSSTIVDCEKMQIKFKEGTSHHSLLKNRIKSLSIAKSLLLEGASKSYTSKDLLEALPPIQSIIHKTTKAQSKYEMGSTQFKRFQHIIDSMMISQSSIESQIITDAK